jgi:hypothetical protein
MINTPPLSELAGTPDVESVLLFVSDALRYDFLPEEVAELGMTAEAIAPSTFTASSIPSLTTGQYPATHQVWMFDDRLPRTPDLLADDHDDDSNANSSSGDKRNDDGSGDDGDDDAIDVGFDAETVWIELDAPQKPPLQIHGLESETELEDLNSPFAHVIHDVGPHAPYGFENGVFDSTKQFFSEYENRRTELAELYREDCHHSAERFLDVYDRLVDRGLLDETLIAFTSDHGQCLGERCDGGRFGHGHPMCPETVRIPIVFVGAGLPEGERYPSLLSGTDIAPTLLSAQRGRTPADHDGSDVWERGPDPDRKIRSDVWQHLEVGRGTLSTDVSVYAATSAWNDSGGYVLHRRSRAQRLAALLYDNSLRGYGPAWRKNASLGKLINLIDIALSDTLTFGAPDFPEAEARALTRVEFRTDPQRGTESSLSEEQRSQLRDLGYLN